jgi:hypothetical protein
MGWVLGQWALPRAPTHSQVMELPVLGGLHHRYARQTALRVDFVSANSFSWSFEIPINR